MSSFLTIMISSPPPSPGRFLHQTDGGNTGGEAWWMCSSQSTEGNLRREAMKGFPNGEGSWWKGNKQPPSLLSSFLSPFPSFLPPSCPSPAFSFPPYSFLSLSTPLSPAFRFFFFLSSPFSPSSNLFPPFPFILFFFRSTSVCHANVSSFSFNSFVSILFIVSLFPLIFR